MFTAQLRRTAFFKLVIVLVLSCLLPLSLGFSAPPALAQDHTPVSPMPGFASDSGREFLKPALTLDATTPRSLHALTVTADTANANMLRWIDTSLAAREYVVRRRTSTTDWQIVAHVGATLRTFRDATAHAGVTYSYQLYALTQNGTIMSNEAWLTTAQPTDTSPSHVVTVYVIDYDPIVNGAPLHQYNANWTDPTLSMQQYNADVSQASGGSVTYQIVARTNLTQFPAFPNGYVLTPDQWIHCYANSSLPHCHDIVDYGASLNTVFDASYGSPCTALAQNNIDEIWFWGGPWFGWYEYYTVMPQTLCPQVKKTFTVMGFNYERTDVEMFHDLGHRAESALQGGLGLTLWDSFDGQRQRYGQPYDTCPDSPDAVHPEVDVTNTHVGNVHFPPNAYCHYMYSRNMPVLSDAESWRTYPNLSSQQTSINATTWCAAGSVFELCERNYLTWWFDHFPRKPGTFNGSDTQWWHYVFPQPYPTITGTTPANGISGGSDFTLTLAGRDFSPASVIFWNGSPRTTSYSDRSHLSTRITATDIATSGIAGITVVNPAPGGGTSDSFAFTVANEPPNAVSLIGPASGVVVTQAPQLCWNPTTDPNPGDTLTYYAEVIDAAASSDVWLSDMCWTPVQLNDRPSATYAWHIRARDNQNAQGPWSETRTFTIAPIINTPNPPTLVSPADGSASDTGSAPQLCWNTNGGTGSDPIQFQVAVTGVVNTTSEWITETCWTPTPLANQYGTFTWHVIARNANHPDQQSGWSAQTWHFSLVAPPDTYPPNPPALSSPADGASVGQSPQLCWNAAVDPDPGDTVQYYAEVINAGESTQTWINDLCWTPAPLNGPSGTTYSWHVRARDNHGLQGDWSETRTFTAVPVTPTPAPPTNFTAWVKTRNAITLTWVDTAADEDGFLIERKTASSPIWYQITNLNSDQTTYIDRVGSGKTYEYRVWAYNGNGVSDKIVSGPIRVSKPAQPKYLTVARIDGTELDLAWQDMALGEENYRIERQIVGQKKWVEIGTVPANAQSFADHLVQFGIAYRYRIRAYNGLGMSRYTNIAVGTP